MQPLTLPNPAVSSPQRGWEDHYGPTVSGSMEGEQNCLYWAISGGEDSSFGCGLCIYTPWALVQALPAFGFMAWSLWLREELMSQDWAWEWNRQGSSALLGIKEEKEAANGTETRARTWIYWIVKMKKGIISFSLFHKARMRRSAGF